jgi:hypothetical protein
VGVDVYTDIFLISALAGGEWQLHGPAALSPVPIGKEVGWTPKPVWTTWRRENSGPYRDSNSDTSVVQPVASRYTGSLSSGVPAPISSFRHFLGLLLTLRHASLLLRGLKNFFRILCTDAISVYLCSITTDGQV